MYLLPLFVICVLVMMKRAERQRQATALEASQIMLDALPEDARERALVGIRERTEAARRANEVYKGKLGIAMLLIAALAFLYIMGVF